LGPVPDPHFAAARLMAELTAQDFPHTPLAITPEGGLQRKVTAVSSTEILQQNTKLPHTADDKSSPGR
jgi:hypothetical protein